MVVVSWGSVFQDNAIRESEITFDQLQDGQCVAYVPCFRTMVDEGKRLLLAGGVGLVGVLLL